MENPLNQIAAEYVKQNYTTAVKLCEKTDLELRYEISQKYNAAWRLYTISGLRDGISLLCHPSDFEKYRDGVNDAISRNDYDSAIEYLAGMMYYCNRLNTDPRYDPRIITYITTTVLETLTDDQRDMLWKKLEENDRENDHAAKNWMKTHRERE